MPLGRPPTIPYTPERGLAVCWQIANGMNLKDIAHANGLPSRVTIWEWLCDEQDFANAYARATEIKARGMFEDLPDLADTATGENAQAVRLQVDTRKWVLSKMLPRIYGDKITADVTLSATLEQLVLKSLERQANDEPKTIEHEPTESE